MPALAFHLRPFLISDYDEVFALWKNTEGMGLGESDSREAIAVFLERNPGLSRVALNAEGQIAGALLCGHDGRRGYLHHLAVAKAERHQGLGHLLVETCLANLKTLGIPKCNLFLFANHSEGLNFWVHEKWAIRDDLLVIQKALN